MNFRILLILTLFSTQLAWSQAPGWTTYAYRTVNYPESDYLVGFMSERNLTEEPEDEMVERLTSYCKDQLAENIIVDIKSISTLNINTVDADTHEEFKRNSTSVSNATIAGLKTENYYDKRKKTAYAFAYAKRSDVINYYANDASKYLDKINNQYLIVKDQIQNGENENALKTLFQLQTTLKNIEYDFTMLVTLTGDYNHPGVKRDDFNDHKLKIQQELRSIRNTDQFKVEDAAFYIAYALNMQLTDKSKPIIINNYTYQDTPMGSSFSRMLQLNLEQKMIQQGFKVVKQSNGNQDALLLNGNYWEKSDRLSINSILREQQSSLAIASVECFLPKKSLETNNIGYKPENYLEAMETMKMFAADEIIQGDLRVDVFTNKGTENLIYTEGEELKLSVRSNKECYIRLIYHLADGTKVLLLDNYYINMESVNKVYEIPERFECAGPFGIETLQLNAQSTVFEPLNTQKEGGYEFILDNTQTVVAKTRGFKKKEASADDDYKAEKRLVFTTMSK
ncbi:MAG: DUF4384 domain-containing protein [Reichenbachiella sp.]